jgi:ABC-2 type transport system permease protein
MAMKDIRLLFRDRLSLFFIILWPLTIAVFFGAMFSGLSSGPESVPVALVDEDRTAASERFAARLEDSELLTVERTSAEQGLDLLRQGRTAVLVTLGPGFGAALDNPFVATPRIDMAVDPTQMAVAGMIRGFLLETAGEELSALITDPDRIAALNATNRLGIEALPPSAARDEFLTFLDLTPRISSLIEELGIGGSTTAAARGGAPLDIVQSTIEAERIGPANAYSVTFPQAMIWALIGGSASFSLSLTVERTRGTLLRLLVSPTTARQVLASKALAALTVSITTTTALIILGIAAFGVAPASYPLLALAVLCGAVCFSGLTMALSVLGSTEGGTAGVSWGLMLPMSLLGGLMFPLFLMPQWIQVLSNVSPMKWALLALEGAVWRGFTPAEMALPCGVLVLIGVVAFSFGAARLRWSAD